MARSTSIEVKRQLEADGTFSKLRLETYKVLFEHGPLTATEVHQRLYADKAGHHYAHNTNSRLGELRNWGAVQEVGTRRCSVTGKNVILWDVTDKMPVKPKKKAPELKTVLDAIGVGEKFLSGERSRLPRKAVELLTNAAKLLVKKERERKRTA